MLSKPLEQIGKGDIEELKLQAVSESLTLDYKRDLYDLRSDKKHEFLEDVSAFANSAGGDILIGVDESEGIPTELAGVAIQNLDALKLDMQNLLRDLIQPRLPNVSIEAIQGFTKGPVILVRIPKSWAAPHMVNLGKNKRFCGRNSSGKYQMDIQQIRSSFLVSQSIQEKIQQFRFNRIAQISSNQGSAQLEDKHRLILHVIPLDAFELGPVRDLAVYWSRQNINKLCEGIHHLHVEATRLNFDGYLIGQKSYRVWNLQYFRNGSIEFVSSDFANEVHQEKALHYDRKYEIHLVKQLQSYFSLLQQAEVPLPYVVALSLIEVAGLQSPTMHSKIFGVTSNEQNALILEPELISTEDQLNAGKVLKPMFDIIWQAMGIPETPMLDAEGSPKS